MLKIHSTTKQTSAGLVRWGEMGHNKPFLVLPLTCWAQMSFAGNVRPCLAGFRESCLSLVTAEVAGHSLISKLSFVQLESPLLGGGLQRAHLAFVTWCLQGRLWPDWLLEPFSVGSGNKLLSSGCHSLWEREAGGSSCCAFGPAELWHACRRFCNFLCTLSACFSLSSAFAFVPKCCYCQEKKNKQKTFAFWLSLPLIICNCCVLDFFVLNIIYGTYMVLMCF